MDPASAQQIKENSPARESTSAAVASVETDVDVAIPLTEAAGDLMLQRGRYVAAIRSLEAVQPRSAALWNKIGVASEHLQMFPKAKLCFEQAIGMDPKYGEAYNNLATVYHAQGDLKEAEKLYRRSIHFQPRGADAYQNLGALLYARGKFHKGDAAYKRAILLDRNVLERTAHHAIQTRDAQSLLEVHYHLARNCALAGNQPLAVEYLHKAITEGFRDTKRLLGEEAFTDLRKTPEFAVLMEDIRAGR